MHHQAALPPGRNAFVAAHRDEEQRHLAAVAVTVRQDIFRNIPDRGVVSGRRPRERPVDPGVDRLRLKVRVVDAGCDRVSGCLDPLGEDHMLLPFGGIFLILRIRDIVGQHFGGVDRMPFAAGGIFKDLVEDGGFVPGGPGLHVDAAVGVGRV